MPTSSKHCLSGEELTALIEGTLTAGRKEHLVDCKLCKAAYEGLELADPKVKNDLLQGGVMPDLIFDAPSSKTSSSNRQHYSTKWLAAACVVAALGWAAWQYYPSEDLAPQIETSPLAYVEQPYRRQMRSAGITTDLYGEAAFAFSKDSFSQSIDLYESAIPKAPTALLRTRGHYEIGIAFWQAGNFEKGIDNLTRARLGELDYYEDATWALAQLYRQMGYLDEAIALYEDLLKIEKSPYLPRAQKMIALIEASGSAE